MDEGQKQKHEKLSENFFEQNQNMLERTSETKNYLENKLEINSKNNILLFENYFEEMLQTFEKNRKMFRTIFFDIICQKKIVLFFSKECSKQSWKEKLAIFFER